MNMRFLKFVIIGTLAAVVLSGCAFLFPKNAALIEVHNAYRTEFASTFLGNAAQGEVWCDPNSRTEVGSFPSTLQAIRDFEIQYPGKSPQANHLTILKGMIHLQVGNTGIARGMVEDVENASSSLAGGRTVRDELFGKAFKNLVDGWEEVCDMVKEHPGGVYANEDSQRIAEAAQGVLDIVVDKDKPIQTTVPSVDEGAIYLATTAGIFYYYAHRIEFDTCKAMESPGTNCNEKVRPKHYLNKAYTAIEKFLGPDEKRAISDPAWFKAIPRGRIGYVRWYGHLKGKAEAAGQLD